MTIITIDGKEYEWRGEYCWPATGDHYLGDDGDVRVCPGSWSHHDPVRAILHPIPVRHVFGGVVFEEVGYRTGYAGDWALGGEAGIPSTYKPYVCEGRTGVNVLILRPVEVQS